MSKRLNTLAAPELLPEACEKHVMLGYRRTKEPRGTQLMNGRINL